MTQVLTFLDYTPAPRFDGNAWTDVRIEEAPEITGPWSTIETLTLTPVDADPRFPASRSFTTENASDTSGLWYRLVFVDATADEELPTLAIQNVPGRIAYATVEELASLLRVNAGTHWQALRRVIESAAYEIDQELGRAQPFNSPPALVVEVNLERAVEHWKQMQSPFGIVGLGADFGPTFTARDSWDRHAVKLAPLKESWGLA